MKQTIYVLTNVSINGMVRIGYTHAAEANLHYPVPYDCYFFQELKEGEDILPAIYSILEQHRKHANLDFFTVAPEYAKDIIQQVYKWYNKGIQLAPMTQKSSTAESVTNDTKEHRAVQFEIFFEEDTTEPTPVVTTVPTPVVTVVPASTNALPPPSAANVKRRRPLTLFKLGLEKGDKIYSSNGHVAEVYSARKVQYKQRLYSLTDLNKKCVNKTRAFRNWKNEFGVTLEQLADMKYKAMGIPKQ